MTIRKSKSRNDAGTPRHASAKQRAHLDEGRVTHAAIVETPRKEPSNVDPNCPACHQPLGSTVNCENCRRFRAAVQGPSPEKWAHAFGAETRKSQTLDTGASEQLGGASEQTGMDAFEKELALLREQGRE